MNLATLVVGCIVAVVFIAIVATSVKNKKKGKRTCSCGGSCGGCALSGSCHSGMPDGANASVTPGRS